MATCSSILAWRIPWTEDCPWGVAKSGTQLKWLSTHARTWESASCAQALATHSGCKTGSCTKASSPSHPVLRALGSPPQETVFPGSVGLSIQKCDREVSVGLFGILSNLWVKPGPWVDVTPTPGLEDSSSVWFPSCPFVSSQRLCFQREEFRNHSFLELTRSYVKDATNGH